VSARPNVHVRVAEPHYLPSIRHTSSRAPALDRVLHVDRRSYSRQAVDVYVERVNSVIAEL
jgi:hypothetical protein